MPHVAITMIPGRDGEADTGAAVLSGGGAGDAAVLLRFLRPDQNGDRPLLRQQRQADRRQEGVPAGNRLGQQRLDHVSPDGPL